jgi:hypothetical protein
MPSVTPQLFTADDTRGSMKGKSPSWKKRLSVCSLTRTRSDNSSTTTAETSMTLSQNQSPLLVSLVEVDHVVPPLPPNLDMSPLTPTTPSSRKKLKKLSNLKRSRSKSSIQHRQPKSEPDLCDYLEAQSGDSGFLSAPLMPATSSTSTTSSLLSRRKQIGKMSRKQTRSSEPSRGSLKSPHQHKRPNSEPDLCDYLEAQTSADSGFSSTPLTPAATTSWLLSRKKQIGKKSPKQTRSSHSRRSLKSSHQHKRPNSEPDLCAYLKAQSADSDFLSVHLTSATTTTSLLPNRKMQIGQKSPKQTRSSEHSRRSLKSLHQHKRPNSEPDLCDFLEAQTSADSGFLSAPLTPATTTTSWLTSRKKQIGKKSPKQTRSSEHSRRSLKSSHQHKRPNSEPDLCDFLEAQTSADSDFLSVHLTPATTTTTSWLTSRKKQIGQKSPKQTRSSEHSRRSLKSSHQHKRPNSEPDLCDFLKAQTSADSDFLSAPLTTATTSSLPSRKKQIGQKSRKQTRSSEHSRHRLPLSSQLSKSKSEAALVGKGIGKLMRADTKSEETADDTTSTVKKSPKPKRTSATKRSLSLEPSLKTGEISDQITSVKKSPKPKRTSVTKPTPKTQEIADNTSSLKKSPELKRTSVSKRSLSLEPSLKLKRTSITKTETRKPKKKVETKKTVKKEESLNGKKPVKKKKLKRTSQAPVEPDEDHGVCSIELEESFGVFSLNTSNHKNDLGFAMSSSRSLPSFPSRRVSPRKSGMRKSEAPETPKRLGRGFYGSVSKDTNESLSGSPLKLGDLLSRIHPDMFQDCRSGPDDILTKSSDGGEQGSSDRSLGMKEVFAPFNLEEPTSARKSSSSQARKKLDPLDDWTAPIDASAHWSSCHSRWSIDRFSASMPEFLDAAGFSDDENDNNNLFPSSTRSASVHARKSWGANTGTSSPRARSAHDRTARTSSRKSRDYGLGLVVKSFSTTMKVLLDERDHPSSDEFAEDLIPSEAVKDCKSSTTGTATKTKTRPASEISLHSSWSYEDDEAFFGDDLEDKDASENFTILQMTPRTLSKKRLSKRKPPL